MSEFVRIYCDANNRLNGDRDLFDLSCVGSARDIDRHRDTLRDGLAVLFYETDSWEAAGTIHYDAETSRWLAAVDFSTLRHLNSGATNPHA